jgi:hypothetical protein
MSTGFCIFYSTQKTAGLLISVETLGSYVDWNGDVRAALVHPFPEGFRHL